LQKIAFEIMALPKHCFASWATPHMVIEKARRLWQNRKRRGISAMKFTEEHLWLRVDDDEGEVTVGLTTYGAAELGEVTFVELPEEGDVISVDDPVVVVEADDDAVDILAPLDGEIVEVNTPLTRAPEVISEDPQGDGWLFRMSIDDPDALDELMDEATYQKYIR